MYESNSARITILPLDSHNKGSTNGSRKLSFIPAGENSSGRNLAKYTPADYAILFGFVTPVRLD